MFEDDSNDAQELKTNLNGSVQARRVSRFPGEDFSSLFYTTDTVSIFLVNELTSSGQLVVA